MVGIQTLSHKLQRIEVQLVALKLAWQIVEVNHVLVAVLHQPDYLLRLVVRQTAEHLVHIGRCSVNRVVDRAVHDLVQFCQGSQPYKLLGRSDNVGICKVSVHPITCRRVFHQSVVHVEHSRVVAHEDGSAAVVAFGAEIFQDLQFQCP